jgi:DNA-binding ferritin-like protein (Dps family)
MYTDNELLFPTNVINKLRFARGEEWRTLVERVSTLPETHEDRLAFSLMMIKLDGCLNCETDSYRAMRGCKACALQTLRRYKGSDQELLRAYHNAQEEIERYLFVHDESIPIEEEVFSARAA